VKKCLIINIGRQGIDQYQYKIGGKCSPVSHMVKGLGVTVDVSLKFTDHINSITAKALRRVGLLFKCFITRGHNILVKAFNTYVRPVLEYASSIWSLTQIGPINRLESVQRRFTKRFPGIGHLTYRERLSALNLESLEIRRLRLDLLLTYKITFGMADIDSHKLFCLRANIKPTTGHGFKLVQEQFETQRCRSFLPARRYASAGYSDRNVSVCLSVCLSVRHAPVLCQNEES